jgi:hypothetical protein
MVYTSNFAAALWDWDQLPNLFGSTTGPTVPLDTPCKHTKNFHLPWSSLDNSQSSTRASKYTASNNHGIFLVAEPPRVRYQTQKGSTLNFIRPERHRRVNCSTPHTIQLIDRQPPLIKGTRRRRNVILSPLKHIFPSVIVPQASGLNVQHRSSFASTWIAIKPRDGPSYQPWICSVPSNELGRLPQPPINPRRHPA